MPRLIDRILHRLAIEDQGIVVLVPGTIPGLPRQIQCRGLNPYQAIANNKFAGKEIAPVFAPAAEAFAPLLAQSAGAN